RAARPRSTRYRGWCKFARARRRRGAGARLRGSVDSWRRARRRGHEQAGRPAQQRARLGFGGPQFTQIAEGLFEVVAEDFRALGGRFPEYVLEPVGVAMVQI